MAVVLAAMLDPDYALLPLWSPLDITLSKLNLVHLKHAFYRFHQFHLPNSFSYSLSSLPMQISCYPTFPHIPLFPLSSFTSFPLPSPYASFTSLDKAASLGQ